MEKSPYNDPEMAALWEKQQREPREKITFRDAETGEFVTAFLTKSQIESLQAVAFVNG